MLTKSKCIVLRCLKYDDKKIIVDLYTEVYGRITSAIKVSGTPKGRMKKLMFQPLTILNIEIDYRQRTQMQRITDAQIAIPWTTLTTDPVKMTVGMFLSEMLYYVTRQEQQDEPLFSFIITSMQWLDATEGNVANFHIAFLIQLTLFLGFMPVMEDYERGQMFDMRTGEFISLTPLHRDFLQSEDAERMHNLLRISYPTMHLFRMTRDERRRCLDIIIMYYRLHLPSIPEIKSLSIMQEIFS